MSLWVNVYQTPTGRAYYSPAWTKREDAEISADYWRGAVYRLRIRLKEGKA